MKIIKEQTKKKRKNFLPQKSSKFFLLVFLWIKKNPSEISKTIIKHELKKFSGICDVRSRSYSWCDSCGEEVFVFFRVFFEKRRRSRRGSASGRRR
jgi:hypothetical protein